MADDAVGRDFGTAELLEHGLSFLPPRFITASASRVCRDLINAIEASPTLQRRTFRAPDHRSEECYPSDKAMNPREKDHRNEIVSFTGKAAKEVYVTIDALELQTATAA